MNEEIRADLLKNIEIFRGIDSKDLDLIAAEMKTRFYQKGDIIFQEGDPGEEFYVIKNGAVSIFIFDNDGNEVNLSELKAGSYFGEMSIIEQAPRSASCRVTKEGEFLILHASDFYRITRTLPGSSVKIMNKMLSITVERLMKTGEFITQMVQWGEESRKRAITDPATGLFNRRYLEDSFGSLFSRAKTAGEELTFVMFDMDRFGQLNTEYGQEFCDKLIIETASIFRNIFGKDDILVRYGGDEFVFLLPGSDKNKAQLKCDNLCETVREMRFPEKDNLRLSCSMGFATFPENASSPEELKDKADRALYQAKEAGRDRAIFFTER